jgi:LPS-assembly protein
LRTPAIERLFDRGLFGRKLKHVIESRAVYRRVIGVDNFSEILRFDDRDILTNTNEIEYSAITRLFAKRAPSTTPGCTTAPLPTSDQTPPPQPLWNPFEDEPDISPAKREACPAPPVARQLISWELTQKYFLDTTFGGAVVSGTRNVFATTADFTAIAFLTSPRHLSPLVSRLRIGPISNIDAGWDLDYDFKTARINASNVFAGFHIGEINVSGGDAYLYIPADILSSTNAATSFHQFRTQVGYGHLNKPGLTGSATFGFDANQGLLQYTAVQATYNWDCCGRTLEYRRFALSRIRDESQYFFTYSLANIGSFGNLTRRMRLY